MSQSVLAGRLGVSAPAVDQLEHAEMRGGITIGKLAEVASALDCRLVYALVPNSSLEATVTARARAVAQQMLGYSARTMALEAQDIDDQSRAEAIERYAEELVKGGRLWRSTEVLAPAPADAAP